jgi:hypothetical protein
MPQAFPAQAGENIPRLVIDEFLCFLFDLETIPLRVSYGSNHARGIIHKGSVMKDTDQPVIEVFLPAKRIVQLAVKLTVETHGHGIDGKVTAAEVVVNRRRLYGWESARL